MIFYTHPTLIVSFVSFTKIENQSSPKQGPSENEKFLVREEKFKSPQATELLLGG
jgi:hypothetical protein